MKITHFINSNNVIVAQTTDKILKKQTNKQAAQRQVLAPGIDLLLMPNQADQSH